MSTSFTILIADDPAHERVFAEIHYKNKFLALISQEDGLERLKVELPSPGLDENYVIREVPLSDFIKLLNDAAEALRNRG